MREQGVFGTVTLGTTQRGLAMAVKKSGARKAAQKPKDPELAPEFLEKLRQSPGFPINLDLRYGKFVFGGHGMGGGQGKPEDDSVTLLVHATVRNVGYALAAIRFNPTNWKEFKRLGDGLLKPIEDSRKKRRKK